MGKNPKTTTYFRAVQEVKLLGGEVSERKGTRRESKSRAEKKVYVFGSQCEKREVQKKGRVSGRWGEIRKISRSKGVIPIKGDNHHNLQ